MNELGKSLVLRYDPGQFTFRHFNSTATDEQLYNLAVRLNAFQVCDLDQVFAIRTFEF